MDYTSSLVALLDLAVLFRHLFLDGRSGDGEEEYARRGLAWAGLHEELMTWQVKGQATSEDRLTGGSYLDVYLLIGN